MCYHPSSISCMIISLRLFTGNSEGNPPSPELWEILYTTFNRSQIDWDHHEPLDLTVNGYHHLKRNNHNESNWRVYKDQQWLSGPSVQREQPGARAISEPAVGQSIYGSRCRCCATGSWNTNPRSSSNQFFSSGGAITNHKSKKMAVHKKYKRCGTQRLTCYKVRGQPTTAYYLTECFHKMIAGHVSCVDQKEHVQREFLDMMMSIWNGTIENWPKLLKEYSMV